MNSSSHGISQNLNFLLHCCEPDFAPKTIGVPDKVLDFGWIRSAAARHGVTPLVAHRLEQMTDGARYDAHAEEILTSARASGLRSDYLVARLIAVVSELERAGIEALVIKGPALAQIAYGDIALRPFGDLDIVVRPEDVPRGAQVLVQAGFDAGPYDDEAFHSNFFQTVAANFQRRDERLNVDLHWELSPPSFPFGPAGEEIWRRAIAIELGGVTLRTLSHEDHLLFLAVHHARHGWDSMSQLCDIAYFVNRAPLDWDRLFARAVATRSMRMLTVALLMAHDHLNAKIPVATLAILRREVRAVRIAGALGAEITRDGPSRGGGLRRLARILGLIERPADRLRYVLLSVFAPTLIDRRYLRVPRALYPAYFLLRPMRIGSAILRTLGRSVRPRKIVDDRIKAV